jgi:hypothetical protein
MMMPHKTVIRVRRWDSASLAKTVVYTKFGPQTQHYLPAYQALS